MTTRLYRGHYIHIYRAEDAKYVAQIAVALAHGPGPDHPDFAKVSPWTECLIRHGSEAAAFTGGRAEVDSLRERSA